VTIMAGKKRVVVGGRTRNMVVLLLDLQTDAKVLLTLPLAAKRTDTWCRWCCRVSRSTCCRNGSYGTGCLPDLIMVTMAFTLPDGADEFPPSLLRRRL